MLAIHKEQQQSPNPKTIKRKNQNANYSKVKMKHFIGRKCSISTSFRKQPAGKPEV
jgi:hypothetical protein